MFCQDVQATEDVFFGLLGVINHFTIKENILSLFRDDKLLLEFSSE
jgi:hypothetical protein